MGKTGRPQAGRGADWRLGEKLWEAGLSMTLIAEELDISVPSVWFHFRHRPKRSRREVMEFTYGSTRGPA
jgi:hypothetical protein